MNAALTTSQERAFHARASLPEGLTNEKLSRHPRQLRNGRQYENQHTVDAATTIPALSRPASPYHYLSNATIMAPSTPRAKVVFSPEVIACVNKLAAEYRGDMWHAPDLSIPQMLVIALVHEGKCLTFEEILATLWGLCPSLGLEAAKSRSKFESKVCYALRLYDFILLKFTQKKHDGLVTYSIWDREARYTLRGHMTAPLRGSNMKSAFFILPPEIRIIIYEMVLAGPKSGIVLENSKITRRAGKKYIKSAYTATRHPTEAIRLEDMQDYMNSSIFPNDNDLRPYIIPRETLHNLFLVNKLIACEAMPIFYGKNHFHARGLQSAVLTFKLHLHSNTTRFLRSVSVTWDYPGRNNAAVLFAALKRFGILRLGIWIEKDWFTGPKTPRVRSTGRPRFENPKKLPGIATLLGTLEDMRKIWVQGDWVEFAQYLRDHSAVGVVEYEGRVLKRT